MIKKFVCERLVYLGSFRPRVARQIRALDSLGQVYQVLGYCAHAFGQRKLLQYLGRYAEVVNQNVALQQRCSFLLLAKL